MITIKRLRSFLTYDMESGNFTWNAGRRNQVARRGDIAGTINNKGYRIIKIDGRSYKAHRLAWFIHYGKMPKDQIDHINGIKSDNRIDNLRECTNQQNQMNVAITKRNTSGIKGVHPREYGRKWRASIKVDYRVINLGTFDDIDEAAAARKKAEQKYFGDFRRD